MKPFVLLALFVGWPSLMPAVAAEGPRFETDVRPILKAHCFQCHGEEPELSGGLDLRLARFLIHGGDSGAAIVPGDPTAGELLSKIDAGEMSPSGKGISADERRVLGEWIAAGAPTVRPEPESIDDSSPWTAEELDHWSFRPLADRPSPRLPDLQQASGVIDAWLLQRLQPLGEGLSGEAPRDLLLRRVSFDLHGLPPEPDEIDRFEADTRPDAFERQVDRLLAAPAFGERWGRHWLDVAGYADSDGYLPSDTVRPWAFRYRDWVIESFDADLPFDRFVIEQLAGDELDPPHTGSPDESRIRHLTATGFLRTAPDGTAGGADDPLQAKHDVVAETLKVITSGLLGLTVGCARCHDHRYDPISQRDYFALAAIFEPAWDLEQWRPPAARQVDLWTDDDRAKAAEIDVQIAEIDKAYLADLDSLVEEIYYRKVVELDASLQETARIAKRTPAAERNEAQQSLLRDQPSLNVDRGSAYLYEPARVNELNDRRKTQTDAARTARPPEQFVACLTELPGRTPTTHLLYRGEPSQPRDELPPADLSLLGTRRAPVPLDDPDLPTSGRRLAWARSLVDGRHPLVGRVWVNRIWALHFGVGLVPSLGDFGQLGDHPSHPELLDRLAIDLARGDWSGKVFHRRIVTSAAYRQSSARRTTLERLDPDNRLWGRMSVRRLETEAIRDAQLAASGELYRRRYGPAVPVTRDTVGQIILGSGERDGNGILNGSEESLGAERFRRSIYLQVRRSMPLSVLEPFDPPTLDPNCTLRDVSTGPNQALLMMNGRFVIERARTLAEDARREGAGDLQRQVRSAWRRAFGSRPSDEEMIEGLAFLLEQQQRFAEVQTDDVVGRDSATLAFETLCQAYLASNRFLYVE